jgi:hypothetical protein
MRNAGDTYAYRIIEISKMISVIRDLTLIINSTQIDIFWLILMSSYKTRYLIRTKLFVYDLFNKIFHDLRS